MIASPRPAGATRSDGYIAELDGLRAISILMVMLGHAGYLFIPAALGVTIFFVISGYLICGMLLREIGQSGSLNLKIFYARRMLRLYPELLVYLAVLILVCRILSWYFYWIQIAAGVFYFTNYLQIYDHLYTHIWYITRPLWSLAVEEHFYLIFPMVILAARGRVATIAWGLLVTIAGVGALRILLFHIWTVPEFYFEYATESRIDAVCGGCLLACITQGEAYAKTFRLFRDSSLWFLAAGVVLIAAAVLVRNAEFRATSRFSLEAVGATLVLGATVWGRQLEMLRQLLRFRPLVFLGRLSYAAYLYHLLIYSLVARFVPINTTSYRFIAIVLSFVAASVSFWAVEVPIRPLRRQLGSHLPPALAPLEPEDSIDAANALPRLAASDRAS